MRLVKILGLAAFAALAVMAFVGVSSAAAKEDVVICKKLVTGKELCPTADILPTGTKILSLAANAKLHSSLGEQVCEDSKVTATTSAAIGNPLGLSIGAPTFGVLPTPTLGEGCTGPCKKIHTLPLENAQLEVEGEDDFFLKASGLAVLSGCTLGITCAYRGVDKRSLIDRDVSTHPAMEGKFDLILVETELSRVTSGEHAGSIFCPGTSNWLASYTVTGCHPPEAAEVLCWIALGELTA